MRDVDDVDVGRDPLHHQTTIKDRPGATVGEDEDKGTSEAAVRHEVQTGKKVGGRWHHKKCEDDARGLINAKAQLSVLETELKTKPRTPQLDQLLADIVGLKADADERAAGLQRGIDI